MESLSRLSIYRYLLTNNELENNGDELRNILYKYIHVLENLEESLLTQDIVYADENEFEQQFEVARWKEIIRTKAEFFDDKKTRDEILGKEIIKPVDVYKQYIIMTKTLIGESNKFFLNMELKKEFFEENTSNVFLSYAFDDRLYTYALYIYMKSRGVNLFVDWMHNGAINDGRQIKRNISKEIEKADQFLFMRTMNSEFNVRGGNIRQWCAWELGQFYNYSKGEDNAFVINLYSKNNKTNSQNNMLHGMKVLSSINNCRLHGDYYIEAKQ